MSRMFRNSPASGNRTTSLYGFPSIQAKTQNRTIRNTLDQRAVTTGVSWKAAENAYKSKYGRKADLTNNQHLQTLYNLMGSLSKPKSKPKSAPKPVAASKTPVNKYQSQIAALTKSIADQQKQNTAARAAALKKSNAASAAAREATQKEYQSQLSAMQGVYASNLQKTKDQFGLQIKGLQTGYGNQIAGLQQNITDQAATYQQNIANQAAQFKAEQQTMMINQERARQAGESPQLRLQESQGEQQAGTQKFKKRPGTQFNTPTYGSLASIKSGTLNI